MFGKVTIAVSRHLRSIQNHSTSQALPQHRILMLAWCFLVVIYGEPA